MQLPQFCFVQEASNQKLDSGSTATIALIADGQLMVASIGDSKALLCSERFETLDEARATLVKLYREQGRSPGSSPSREDEKIRVEAAGGYVTEWAGVPRVNGQLAVSRSIGDLSYKSYGVISAPEVMDWQPLAANDSYLVVPSDGIFEKLELQDVCDRLWEVNNRTSSGAGLPSYCSISLAECLVNTAFEKGSMDNMAAVVVPLKPNPVSQSQAREKFTSDKTAEFASGLQMKNTYALPYGTFGPLQLKLAQPSSTIFNELLILSQLLIAGVDIHESGKMWNQSYGKHDLESAQTPLYPMMMESPELRWSFIRKVYSIISIQLLVTIAVAATVVTVHPISVFFTTTGLGFALYILLIFTPLIVMCPLYYYHQKHPVNYLLLGIFTVSLACAVGLTCAFTSGKVILESVILTSVVVISLTLYTFWAAKRGQDFNFLGPFLFGAVIVLMVFSFIQILFPLGKISVMIYGCLASIIFCAYIVYDTDNLIKRHSYDEYIWAAVSLYLDVINLFLSLLTLLRAADS
ncbi:unnamed protein product [Arabis nemorensis]|uniref:PPM-type phosphatase domain-containing protein n=1 Tax=Arabis nemorensis TaxID=586526 RepID=A0A565BZ84_9BRAS|nr:unnamed protein product [Arabis nemorensis]